MFWEAGPDIKYSKGEKVIFEGAKDLQTDGVVELEEER